MTAAYVTDGHHYPPRGTRGGGDGAPSVPFKTRADGSEEAIAPIAQVDLEPGELLGHLLSGGGGYGDPVEREPELVLEDVLAGFVTAGRARDVYGVVLIRGAATGDLAVDAVATRLRRDELRGAASGEGRP
jgi:N-methylhydantoinase B